MEANANKYTFVRKKSTTKYELCVLAKPETLMSEFCSCHGIITAKAEEMLMELETRFTDAYVSGSGHRKSQIQRQPQALSL